MTHHMKLNPLPFAMIKNGQKTIELRLYDEKRRQIRTGDTLFFTDVGTGETLLRFVTKLHRFESFEALYKSLPLLSCGYTAETVRDAHPSDMDQYYSPEEQRKYGVVGIELTTTKEEPAATAAGLSALTRGAGESRIAELKKK